MYKFGVEASLFIMNTHRRSTNRFNLVKYGSLEGRTFKLRLQITRSETVTCRNMGEPENTLVT